MSGERTAHYDIVIIGGGLVGLTAANALAHSGLSIAVVERHSFEKIAAAASDGRASAIAQGSYLFFDEIDIWQDIEPHAGPMLDIRVSDGDSKLFLHYDHKLVGDAPVGYMVENHIMLKTLIQHAKAAPNITLYDECNYQNITFAGDHVTVTLSNEQILLSRLCVAADGRGSKVRQLAGLSYTAHNYHQCGIVCNVHHEKPHRSVAQERFLPSGPFAILPLKDPNQSSLVWTEKERLAPTFMKMDDKAFNEQLYKRFGGYLGDVKVISKRFSYPLNIILSERYTSNRLILVGDAAHGIHPLAGQGFNLGIRDCDKLYQLIMKQAKLGLDIADPSLLAQYNDLRFSDALSLAAITHSLNLLFCSNSPLAKLARRTGMATLNHFPSVKRFFMKHAMGMRE